MRERLELVMYTRAGCCLCHDAWARLQQLGRELSLELRAVDITGDPQLEERYDVWLPVGELAGERVFEYAVDAERLREACRRLRGARA